MGADHLNQKNNVLKKINQSNEGSVSVEAAIAFPLFLFVMLFFIYLSNIYTVKAAVYEGAVETTEYMAEYAYLTDCFEEAKVIDYPMVKLRFDEYLDSKSLVEKYVVGGVNGVSFLGSSFPDEDGYIEMEVTYFIKIDIPIIGSFKQKCREHIKQKAYLGRDGYLGEDADEEEDEYVFVAKNGVVYHKSRSCTYLMPKISTALKEKANGYRACEYCGKNAGAIVFITEEGDCYHSVRNCSRLKRTVERKKLSEVNLPPCSKCAGKGH